MWKFLLSVALLMSLGEAQRSFYAPRPGSYPKLLPKYRQNQTETTNTTPTTTTTTGGLDAREGDENFPFGFISKFPPEFHGTFEDKKFVQRVSKWPEDRQPFWYKNRKAISSMTDRNIDGGDLERPMPPIRSPFAGSRPGTSSNAARLTDDISADNELNARSTDPLVWYLRSLHKS